MYKKDTNFFNWLNRAIFYKNLPFRYDSTAMHNAAKSKEKKSKAKTNRKSHHASMGV